MKEVDNLRWVMLGVLARLNTIQYFFLQVNTFAENEPWLT